MKDGVGHGASGGAKNGMCVKTGGICLKCLLVLAGGIFLFFAWYGFRFTCYTGTDYANRILTKADHMGANAVFFLLTLLASALLFLLEKKAPEGMERAWKLAFPVCSLFVCGLSLWWAFSSGTWPDGDQLIISSAAENAIAGNLDMMTRGGYLYCYPQQLGMVGLLELVFGLSGPYHYELVYVLYAFMNGLCVFFGSLLLRETGASCGARFLYLLFMGTCFPYYIYTPYVYGDIPSLCLCMIAFWAIARLEKSGRLRYLEAACAALAAAVMLRKNSLIVVCAAIICMLVTALLHRRWLFAAGALAFALSALLPAKGLELFYERRFDMRLDGGIPAACFIAMGMQEGDNAPGRYNNYTKEVYYEADCDPALASALAGEYMRERWRVWKTDPGDMIDFYREKLLTQWNEPLFESLQSNHVFAREPRGFMADLYYGKWHDRLLAFCDGYLFLVYAGALLCMAAFWKKRGAGFAAPLIAIAGGFLFSLLWEAQCRYVLPYFVFSVLFAACGLAAAGRWAVCAAAVCRDRIAGKRGSAESGGEER